MIVLWLEKYPTKSPHQSVAGGSTLQGHFELVSAKLDARFNGYRLSKIKTLSLQKVRGSIDETFEVGKVWVIAKTLPLLVRLHCLSKTIN